MFVGGQGLGVSREGSQGVQLYGEAKGGVLVLRRGLLHVCRSSTGGCCSAENNFKHPVR